MESKFGVFYVLFLLIITCSVSDGIPCDKFVKIESKELYSYLARITFLVPKSFTGQWKLEMKTNVPYLFVGCWGVRVKTDDTNELAEFESIESVTVKAGQEISFRFRISWAPGQPMKIPYVQQLIWNKERICLSPAGIDSVYANSIVKYE